MEKRATILVVDDASVNLQLCKGILCSEYDVRLAKSGKMALDALERLRPDLILLDIEMPDMSGFEVMDHIRRNPNLKGIPIIFVTSHATENLVTRAIELGAVNYIVKPFDADILLSRVQGHLGK